MFFTAETQRTRRYYHKTGLLLLLAAGCLMSFNTLHRRPFQAFTISGEAQGTTYHITYYAADSIISKQQTDSLLRHIDSSLSIYKPYSRITAFNNAEHEVEMDLHLRKVITRSREINNDTKGISDITVYPLVNLWGFGPRPEKEAPDSTTIQRTLSCIGMDKLSVAGKKLIKKIPCLQIDVNGIAQGYSVDVLANWLETRGIRNYLVEIGGELKVKGKKYPGKSILHIGIEAPAPYPEGAPVIQKIVRLKKGAITTSGNYRKFHEVNGKKITHLISPQTGYPFSNNLISVTVWAKDAITADGYDNALMGMGMENALKFLKTHPKMEAYFIYQTANGTVRDTATSGFYKMML